MNPTMADVREALASGNPHDTAYCPALNGCWCGGEAKRAGLLARLDGMTILPTAEVERLRADSLGAAWAETKAALPEGIGLELAALALDDWAEAVAGNICEQAESPVAALRALRAALDAPKDPA